MKRRGNRPGVCLLLNFSWSVAIVVAMACFLSCACRSKVANQASPSQSAKTPAPATQEFVAKDVLEKTYADLTEAVKAREGYKHYGEFLDRGRYQNSFMRLDMFQYLVFIPSDAALEQLGNDRFTQLIYPEVATKEHLEFFHRHLAFRSSGAGAAMVYRTMGNKIVKYEANHTSVGIGNIEASLEHDASLGPAIRLLFINQIIQ